MILDIFFRAIDFLERHSLPIIVIVIFGALILLWYIPVAFGMALIFTILIFLIGSFDLKQIPKSFARLCIFLFLLGVIASPILFSLTVEKYRLNHPASLLDRNNPEIIEMTNEFDDLVFDFNNTEEVLNELEDYVYEKIPYYWVPFSPYPTTEEVISKMNSDCKGRAVIGYSILKNLGYDVDIVYSFGGHAWLKVYEDNSYFETFLVPRKYEPWVIFNEEEVKWEPSLSQISRFLVGGIYMMEYIPDIPPLPSSLFDSIRKIKETSGMNLIDFATPLPFALPILALAIFILFISKEGKIKNYILAIFAGIIVVSISGVVGVIINRMLLPLPIIIASGIYLRILSLIFPSKDNSLSEKYI